MHIIVARVRVRPGSRDAFVAASEELIVRTRAEEGCQSYALHEDVHEPNSFLFFEEWRDRAAIDAHFQEPHFLAFGEAAGELIEEKSIVIHEVAGSDRVD